MSIAAFYPPAEKLLVPWNYQFRNGVARVPLFREDPESWVLHVAQGNGSLEWFRKLKKNLRFSHLWFAKDGSVEQYGDLRRISWAQCKGNFWGWSCETEGWDTEPLTDAQIESLARWHVWCGARDWITNDPSEPGIGTHVMGGADWGGHECPGKIRAAQRKDIIELARKFRTGLKGKDVELKETLKLSNGTTATVEQCVGGLYMGTLGLRNATDQVEGILTTVAKRLVEQNALITEQNATMAEIRDALKAGK